MKSCYHDEVRAAYDQIADEYLERIAGTKSTPELKAQVNSYVEELRSRLPPRSKVVDLGCGAGLPATAALAESFEVTGVDFSARQIELARASVPGATFIQADMTEISFPAESLDAVTAFFSIIHIHRDLHADLFRRISSWLKPGGLLVATLGKRENEEDWDNDWLGARMFWSYNDPDAARKQIMEAGMTIKRARFETVEEGIDGPETFFWVIASRNE